MAQIDQLLTDLTRKKASDLHLAAGSPPIMRCDGELVRVRCGVLTPDTLELLLFEIASDAQRQEFEALGDVDFAYELPGVARFRVNVFRQHRGVGAVLRTIPDGILTADDLRLPDQIRRFCDLNQGLVLVTGPTGSGKSTTLAAMIDLINETRADHILTIEDPIEFTHANKKGLVNQRQIGIHTESFNTALRAALREDPDVILVGEMRDLETIALGITAAETGHLVFATLHTNSAPKTVDRLIDAFPADQQGQIRAMLSETLRGVVTQQLLPTLGGPGRVAAFEILVVTPAIANMIREGKTHQIPNLMQTGRKDGMVTMDHALTELVKAEAITREAAHAKANNKALFLPEAQPTQEVGWQPIKN
jgi:twitching motility protein PilT